MKKLGDGGSVRLRIGLAVGACLFGAACLAVTVVDATLSDAARSLDLPGDLNKAINLSEVFAHGLGVACILGAILVVAPRRPGIWLAIWITTTSGLVANGLKSAVVRVRPHAAHEIVVRDTAAALTPPEGSPQKIVEASFWDARQRSFPSGHAATAAGLAVGLSIVFPRGCLIFAMLGCLACVQRITSGAHFLSDVLAGIAIAFGCSALLLSLLGCKSLRFASPSIASSSQKK